MTTRVLLGVDGLARTAAELDLLRTAGADLELVALARGPVLENIETPTGRRQRCISPSDPIPVDAVPARWATRATAAFVLTPVAGELGEAWAGVAPGGALVALGWQGLLRTLAPGRDVARRSPAPGRILARADLVVVSDDDLGPAVRPSVAVALLRPGATLVITRGERGGSAFTRPPVGRAALRTYSATPPRELVDPTGAGDAFLAALVATAVAGSRLGVSTAWSDRLRFAAAAASLVVEGPGLGGVPDAGRTLARLDRRA